MKLGSVVLALALATTSLALIPSANAANEPVCDDRNCLVSIETYVCVTEPCDGMVICLAHGRICTNDL